MGHTLFSDDPSKLDELVDWPLMKQDYWNDINTYPDRKERRQAEFLVHQTVPWTAVHGNRVIRDVAVPFALRAICEAIRAGKH